MSENIGIRNVSTEGNEKDGPKSDQVLLRRDDI